MNQFDWGYGAEKHLIAEDRGGYVMFHYLPTYHSRSNMGLDSQLYRRLTYAAV